MKKIGAAEERMKVFHDGPEYMSAPLPARKTCRKPQFAWDNMNG